MVTINDFIELQITDDIATISLWMAKRRILYEYPGYAPAAFGEYDESHIPNIQKGIIGELITFDYLHTKLDEKFGRLHPAKRWRAVKDRLCLQNHIGCFDTGSDLTIREKTVDVKTYHERLLAKERMMNYNLFVSTKEVQGKDPADFYIQAFFTPDKKIVLAGCHPGLPQHIRDDLPTPAHACRIPDLMPIAILEDLLLEAQ